MMISPSLLAAHSLAFAQDEFYKADAIADAALEALAEFSNRAQLWKSADVRTHAELSTRAYEAEASRQHAKRKMLWEFCHALEIFSEEDAQQEDHRADALEFEEREQDKRDCQEDED